MTSTKDLKPFLVKSAFVGLVNQWLELRYIRTIIIIIDILISPIFFHIRRVYFESKGSSFIFSE